ncbi:MAG: serine/threonine protein kinase [Leptospiraceae bacterium]|nr:serine/threonine protein kinase [Leptospiraceae bacterium]
MSKEIHPTSGNQNLFYTLTPELVLDELQNQGFAVTGHYFALNSLENRVFDLQLQTGEHIVAKFYRPGRWNKTQLLEEHTFVRELFEADVPVLPAKVLPHGDEVGEAAGIFFSVWPRIGGREPGDFTDEDYLRLGRLYGKLHAVGQTTAMENRSNFNAQKMIADYLPWFIKNIPEPYLSDFLRITENVTNLYNQTAKEARTCRIHGDAHPGNLLVTKEGFLLLDFDDSMNGIPAQDLWMMLPGSLSESQHEWHLLLEGYETFNFLDRTTTENIIEILRAMRIIHYSGWVGKRIDDPSFKAAFPEFGTSGYWQREVSILTDQMSRILG